MAFLLGAIATVVGTLVAYAALPLGEAGWQLAAVFCATYIGGSVNFAATAETVGLRSSDLLSAGVAADNLVMTLYFLLLFALPSIPGLRLMFPTRWASQGNGVRRADFQIQQSLQPLDPIQPLAVSAMVCAVGYGC